MTLHPVPLFFMNKFNVKLKKEMEDTKTVYRGGKLREEGIDFGRQVNLEPIGEIWLVQEVWLQSQTNLSSKFIYIPF